MISTIIDIRPFLLCLGSFFGRAVSASMNCAVLAMTRSVTFNGWLALGRRRRSNPLPCGYVTGVHGAFVPGIPGLKIETWGTHRGFPVSLIGRKIYVRACARTFQGRMLGCFLELLS